MTDPVDERALFAATFGATFTREYCELFAVIGREPDAAQLKALAHEAIRVARAAIQGTRALGDGARTL